MPIVTIKPHVPGFTLVEMLVVVLLIGLLLGVGLTLDFGTSPQRVRQQGEAFANEFALAADEAVLDGSVLGLDFFVLADGRSGYRRLRLEGEAWTPTELPDADAETQLFAEDVVVELLLDGQALALEDLLDLGTLAPDALFAPEILLLPTRESTPFSLHLGAESEEPLVLSADLLGRIRVNEDAPTPP